MTSTQIPHPSKSALLSASNLESLASPHEKNRVQEFVASQTRYAKAQANEGRAVRASWDISTPEKDKMRLHLPSAGFETPVLRPRAAQIPVELNPNVSPSSPLAPRVKSPAANKPDTSRQSLDLAKKEKATSAVRDVVSPKRKKRSGEKSTTKKSGTSNPTHKERRARSDTDEEHLASTDFSFPRHSRFPAIYGRNRAYRATGGQACKKGCYESTRSQSRHKGREREQEGYEERSQRKEETPDSRWPRINARIFFYKRREK